MRVGPRAHGMLAAASALAVVLAAAPAWAALDKCQSGIQKAAQKLQLTIQKGLTKCSDLYQRAVLLNQPLTTAGAQCQTQLAKISDIANPVSALAKTKLALDNLLSGSSPKCTDTDLFSLGHLPASVFGDRWARLILLGALKGAYATQNGAVAVLPSALTALAGAGCTECQKFITPPCQVHACVLGTGTGATTTVLGVPVPVTLSGSQFFEFCEFPGVLTNELAVVASNPARNFQPALVLGTTICTTTFRTSSVINCSGGTAPTVSISTCQDSDLSDGNECPPPGPTTFCQPNPNSSTGGPCVSLTTSAAAAGQSFTIATTFLRISTAAGADGVSCTPDDTYLSGAPATIPVTTATATASVLDYGNTNGNTQTAGPVSGLPSPSCAQLRSSNVSGGKLVTAFPNADTTGSPLGDTVTSLSLVCS